MAATQIAHWPGNDVPVCEDHAVKLKQLATIMGFWLSLTPCEEIACTNCENEAKKLRQ